MIFRIPPAIWAMICLFLTASEPASAVQPGLLEGCRHAVAEMGGRPAPTNGDTTFNIAYCFGWVQGMRQMSDYWQDKEDKPKLKFYVPKDTTIGQIVREIVRFVDRNPHAADKNEVSIYLAAMRAAFPRPM